MAIGLKAGSLGRMELQAGIVLHRVAGWDACRVAGWVAGLGDHLALSIVDLVRARAEIVGECFVAHQQQVGVAVLDEGEVGQVEPEVGHLVRVRPRLGARAGLEYGLGLGPGLGSGLGSGSGRARGRRTVGWSKPSRIAARSAACEREGRVSSSSSRN